jgi:hypothetical protein
VSEASRLGRRGEACRPVGGVYREAMPKTSRSKKVYRAQLVVRIEREQDDYIEAFAERHELGTSEATRQLLTLGMALDSAVRIHLGDPDAGDVTPSEISVTVGGRQLELALLERPSS